jgi:O-6-methylguanine DNA methyltransferase
MGMRVAAEIAGYFGGTQAEFTVPLTPAGTPFQHEVWDALRRIPPGVTRSYGQVAAEIGRLGGARAVGQANARNPIPILIPCHRVLAADGSVGGYLGEWGRGEGLAIKRWLLAHESR